MPTQVSEAVFERMLDRRVWRRLETDGAYRNAENPSDQKQREDDIEREELAVLEDSYSVREG
jgi:hypothetical protein